jgi:50S ribosomal protein L16 3-hydroxylase
LRLASPPRATREDFEEFLGLYLTEPKANVFFDTPEQSLSAAVFARQAARQGLRLDLQTQMLHRGKRIYVNGEGFALPAGSAATQLRALAAARTLAAAPLAGAALPLLYAWYEYGWLHLGIRS